MRTNAIETEPVEITDIPDSSLSGQRDPHGIWQTTNRFQTIVKIDLSAAAESTIPDGTFCFLRNVTSVTFGDSTKTIGRSAFEGCVMLDNVVLPNQLLVIEDQAFIRCSSLTSISFPNSLESIGSGAFAHCSNLRSVPFPKSLRSIGRRAFAGCSGLTSVAFPDSLSVLGAGSFAHCLNLRSVAFRGDLTQLGDGVFYGCALVVLLLGTPELLRLSWRLPAAQHVIATWAKGHVLCQTPIEQVTEAASLRMVPALSGEIGKGVARPAVPRATRRRRLSQVALRPARSLSNPPIVMVPGAEDGIPLSASRASDSALTNSLSPLEPVLNS